MVWSLVHYPPHPLGYLLLFALVLGALMLVLRFVLVDYAFLRLGLRRWTAVTLLWGSLLGSGINIPVARLASHVVVHDTTVDLFGLTYVVPQMVESGRTIVAVNIGGALIPTLLSIYLLIRFGVSWRLLGALVIVTGVVHLIAHPLPGVGIAMPPVLAAVVAAGAAILLNRAEAARTAYVAGSMGTLIGADLMNLNRVGALGAPVLSIGGAGTFDGVFVTGVAAVLLASIVSRRSKGQALNERPAPPP